MTAAHHFTARSILAIFGLLASQVFAGNGDVKTVREEWNDARRHRVVPVKIYYPAAAEKPSPVIIFSHGLGGSRDAYEIYGLAWARAGFVSVHLQHAGSDEALWRDGQPGDVKQKLAAGMTLQAYLDRVDDVKFAIDRLESLAGQNASAHVLAGPDRLDLKRIAMAGHSFGAQTTQAIAGQIAVSGRREISLADKRVTCAIALSPAPPRAPGQDDRAFSKIEIPVLWMTGKNDTSPMRETRPADRRVPFDKTAAKDQYLVLFNDADHMVFSGRGPWAAALASTIEAVTTAFLEAHLRDDARKKGSLVEDLKGLVKDKALVEAK